MRRREFIVSSVAGSVGATLANNPLSASGVDDGTQARPSSTRKILIAGGNYNTAFIRYMVQLTGKPRPKLLYLPTASADSPNGIIAWYRNCAPLNVEPSHQISFIASTQQSRTWEEVLLSVDGIVCSGGNTLNQQVIWKAHGIDAILKTAWDRGIVLGGASAGSLCWFEHGTTDSRPKELSRVDSLGFLQGSHSPHYDAEPGRRPLYQKLIGSGEMKSGYACDNDAGIFFEDDTVKRVVSARSG
ncbi:MAG TPA: peptidase E, partial [Vicinamibacterales bacterium]